MSSPSPAGGWGDWDSLNDLAKAAETAKIVPAGFAAGDEFGHSVAVDDSTGTIVAGAWHDDSNEGSAYVFTEPTGGWSGWGTLTDPAKANLTATLTASNAAVNDYFGHSVAVDGDTVLIGASGRDSGKGAVYAFTKPETDGGWVSTSTAAKLTAETRGDDDYFGRSVAIDGDTIVVGADEAENTVDGSQVKTGSAYVFTKPGTGWATDTETAKLTASDSAATDKFGYAVALDGDIVVVGAYGNDSSRGSAYVFTKPGTGWANGIETAQLTASDAADNDRFGSSVAIDDDTVVIGAENNETAYVFDIVDWERHRR